MVTVGVFEFCVMRCQPLRRALCVIQSKRTTYESSSDGCRNKE
ncbi:acetyltransferase [Vibrio cholerae]|nr:acetyltransferase [Vibrio cholerae]EKF9238381.1 acetyltransferase [Vibrio cholerae]